MKRKQFYSLQAIGSGLLILLLTVSRFIENHMLYIILLVPTTLFAMLNIIVGIIVFRHGFKD